jgi:hypothetical protein
MSSNDPAVLGRFRLQRGCSTPASRCVTWDARCTAIVAAVAARHNRDNSASAKEYSAFEAVKHEYRATNQAVVARESDTLSEPIDSVSSSERYHVKRGRLLAFKNDKR